MPASVGICSRETLTPQEFVADSFAPPIEPGRSELVGLGEGDGNQIVRGEMSGRPDRE